VLSRSVVWCQVDCVVRLCCGLSGSVWVLSGNVMCCQVDLCVVR